MQFGETTAYGRRQRLEAMAEGLDLKDVYGATLERIKEEGGEKASVPNRPGAPQGRRG